MRRSSARTVKASDLGASGDAEPLPEPENRTRPDGTHRIEFELWLARPPQPTGMHAVRYWPDTPREGEHITLQIDGATFSGTVRGVLWNDEGVPLIRFN